MSGWNGRPLGLTRRRFNHLAIGSSLAGMALMTHRGAMASGELHSLTWNGYQEPEILGFYIEKYGEMPPATYFGDVSEAFVLANSGTPFDTAHVDLADVARWHDAGLLKPIDTARIPHWNDVFDEVKALDGVTINGETFFLPCDWGTNAMIVREDLIDPAYLENPTWELFWDERYRDKLAMYDDSHVAIIIAAQILGFDDPKNLSDEELNQAIELLREQKDLLRMYFYDQTSASQALASGEIAAAVGWSSIYAEAKAEGVPVRYLYPQEGAHTWIGGISWVSTGSGDEQRFYDFANAWLSSETGAFLLEVYGYGHSNRNAYDLVEQGILDDVGMTDAVAALDRGYVYQPMDPELSETYTVRYEEMKAGF